MQNVVKKLLFAAALPLSALCVSVSADAATLNVHNLESVPVSLVYISPTWTNHFRGIDQDLDGYIMPGQTASIDFTGGNDCNFDLRAVFGDGENVDSYGFNVCDSNDWYL